MPFNNKLLKFLFIHILLLLSGCHGNEPSGSNQVISNLHKFTGSPARLVWVQDLLDNKDVHAVGRNLALMGYDSEDGRKERVILPGPENFILPFVTPSGEQVVFSDFNRQIVMVVDWSGKNRRNLTKGLAFAVWRDPNDGIDWVYVARNPIKKGSATFQLLYRIQLKKPSVQELVWDKSPFGGAIQLSGDGRFFSSVTPWPNCSIIDLDNMKTRRYGKGCWPALAPDLSYRFWFFDGSHRNLEMIDTRTGVQNKINLANAPGIEGYEVYHPRWSNHPRYMVMTGPYTTRQGGNNIAGGGEGVEVYIGRFNKDYTEIEAWFKVTTNQRADFYPDLWIKENEQTTLVKEQSETPADHSGSPPLSQQDSLWPVVNKNLLFAWQNVAAKNKWTGSLGELYQADIEAKGSARFALNYQMYLGSGWYIAKIFPKPEPKEYVDVKALSVEFVLTPPKRQEQTDVRLLALGQENENQIILQVEQGFLTLKERSKGQQTQARRLDKLPSDQAHVLIDIEPEKVTLRIGTGSPKSYSWESSKLIAWPLIIGDPRPQNNSNWNGLMERLALYTGALNDQDVKQSKQLYAQMQQQATGAAIKPVVVRAELVSASSIPTPEDILPYRRGLVVNEYRIIKVVQGNMTDENILVAHWAILDGKSLPNVERRVGEVYELWLDTFDRRPELEGERLSMGSDNLLLTMYYDLDLIVP